ncbi:hypothetical protein EAH89_15350 [Roseomonas nepalensis]|uniref:Uncharacterized protein n=1 Tax=Muricoccus nepalensis TaxID=1854500 RepID=A0A502FVY7_9PROT|nr:hypothetical protein [Roseomonas nepalensis]TPG53817.1 hypothetical protein EAH89_15350 [Roseomonas nepalensis]
MTAPRRPDGPGAKAAAAEALARELAPDLSAVIITHYPDAETLDTFRPGEADLAAVAAVNRAVAAAMAEEGVEVLVQVADRASFRRWMDGRPDTPANRLAWRRRDGLLRGAAALAALGLDPRKAGPREAPPAGGASLSPAERLMRAFAGEDDRAFRLMAERLLAEGRQGVLALAVRKVADRYGEEAADDLDLELLQIAEGAAVGPSGWAELVALPVALPPGALPDAASLGGSLLASGLLGEALEVRFLPEWRSPDSFGEIEATALRRALASLAEGREPAELPPADPASLQERGFGVLLGLQVDWALPSWEELAANGLPPAPEGDDADGPEEETPEEMAFRTGFDRWRMAVSEAVEGCVPLALVPPSEVVAEIDDFIGEAGIDTGGIEEIRDFVETARREVPDEEVVCRPEVVGEALEITLYTRAGRFLDSLTLSRDQMPVPAEEMPRLLEAFVPMVRDAPGR